MSRVTSVALRAPLQAIATGALMSLLATLLVTLGSSPAVASTSYLGEAVNAIKASAVKSGDLVYVSPDVPNYEQARSQVAGQPGQLIALVEVPTSALAETAGDGQTFANELDELTGRRYIIGVAFVSGTGDSTTGTYFTATSRIEEGEAISQLNNASNRNNTPEAVLSAFGNNVETWLTDNPGSLQPVAQPPGSTSSPSASPHRGGGGHGGLIALAVLLVLVGLACWGWRRWLRSTSGLLWQIERVKQQFGSEKAKETVESICQHSRRYLVVAHDNLEGEDLNSARRNTHFNLERTLRVVRGYLKMELHPSEWHGDTNERLRRTRQTMSKFDEDVEEAIRLANEGRLAEFEMDTTILENSVV